MVTDWLYDKVMRVPEITDEQIAEMLHIRPLLHVRNEAYRLAGWDNPPDPRNSSFLWDAKPIGEDLYFHAGSVAHVITTHKSSVFFKPSLAEVYAWIRVYCPENWRLFTHFCLGEVNRIPGSTDCYAVCSLFGGKTLVCGKQFGPDCYELVEQTCETA